MIKLLAMFLAIAFAGGILLLGPGCATTSPPPSCNPVMTQCNPADYPPLTNTLPKFPFPRHGVLPDE